MSSKERYNYFCMFTPEGKILPIEGVIRSTEHGSPCVALRNKNMAIIIAQRTGKNDKLTEGKTKIKQLDSNLVYVYAGITNDGIKFGNDLRDEIQYSKYIQGTSSPISQLLEEKQFSNALEIMRYGRRASGISVIIAGVDRGKIEVIEMGPTGEAIPCFGACIGSRAQSARTILESHTENIYELPDEDLMSLGIAAFRNAVNDPEVMSNGHFDVCRISLTDGVVFTPGSEIETAM
ncbi:20S proteasome subunit alpha 6 [Nematocida minor]|uniref:20S proteasome subunit alpha 6 n=1 Tax=Nematocida minor TaxID=1912983 RepID=UPI00221EB9C8|nr:20S proteasome subunit alpha 6 [Nematocida minor]KAI5191921.1 20S proteasome subunit alpha 6 [Nematocida minor]